MGSNKKNRWRVRQAHRIILTESTSTETMKEVVLATHRRPGIRCFSPARRITGSGCGVVVVAQICSPVEPEALCNGGFFIAPLHQTLPQHVSKQQVIFPR